MQINDWLVVNYDCHEISRLNSMGMAMFEYVAIVNMDQNTVTVNRIGTDKTLVIPREVAVDMAELSEYITSL